MQIYNFEKVVFNNNSEINNALKKLKHLKLAWVNCNYQTIPYFIELRDKLKSKKFSMQVFDENGLWEQVQHFLDLFCIFQTTKSNHYHFFSYKKTK